MAAQKPCQNAKWETALKFQFLVDNPIECQARNAVHHDHKLLSDLSRCGWEALKALYTTGVRGIGHGRQAKVGPKSPAVLTRSLTSWNIG